MVFIPDKLQSLEFGKFAGFAMLINWKVWSLENLQVLQCLQIGKSGVWQICRFCNAYKLERPDLANWQVLQSHRPERLLGTLKFERYLVPHKLVSFWSPTNW